MRGRTAAAGGGGRHGKDGEGTSAIRADTATQRRKTCERPPQQSPLQFTTPSRAATAYRAQVTQYSHTVSHPAHAGAGPNRPPDPPPLQRTESLARTAQLIFFFPSVARTKHTGPSCMKVHEREAGKAATMAKRHTPSTRDRQTPREDTHSGGKDAAT